MHTPGKRCTRTYNWGTLTMGEIIIKITVVHKWDINNIEDKVNPINILLVIKYGLLKIH